jgi:Uma2 family endonuclease
MSTAAVILPPVLREGDRLTAAEFLRRWEAMPELKRAELIDGIVFMPSPVSQPHADHHLAICLWLGLYMDSTPGCAAGSDATWLMGANDVPQPDVALRILPEYGGQSHNKGDYSAGAPELIVEISGSSSSRDLGIKLELYRRAGVREYLTVLLKPRQAIWRQLVRGRYREIAADEDGLLRSRVFPGLWLNPAALWDSKLSLRTAVEQGLRSPEHAAFVKRLAAAARSTRGARPVPPVPAGRR